MLVVLHLWCHLLLRGKDLLAELPTLLPRSIRVTLLPLVIPPENLLRDRKARAGVLLANHCHTGAGDARDARQRAYGACGEGDHQGRDAGAREKCVGRPDDVICQFRRHKEKFPEVYQAYCLMHTMRILVTPLIAPVLQRWQPLWGLTI